MAWTLDTKAQGTRVSTPLTLSYTCGATAKLLVVAIFVNGITARTGNAPTYNGVTMTDSGQGFLSELNDSWNELVESVKQLTTKI